jgi:hypothetical protein
MSSTGWVVQLLLPLYDNEGRHFDEQAFALTRSELLDKFRGLTAYQRTPARGLWKKDDGNVARDEVVVFEVMTAALDRAWWRDHRERLQQRFRQEVIVIRATEHELL